jgi:hypothetical protein
MPGCGYICPKCDDRGFDDEGVKCTWCQKEENTEEDIKDWLDSVHEGPCCSHPEE